MDDGDLQTESGRLSDGVNSQTGGIAMTGLTEEPHNFDSTGSSSTQQPKAHDSKKKVVINYADHVKAQMMSTGGPISSDNEQVSDRSRSNISIGYNHEPTSPMRHRSSANVGVLGDPSWPTA